MTAVDVDALDKLREAATAGCPGSGTPAKDPDSKGRNRCPVCDCVVRLRVNGTVGPHPAPTAGPARVNLPGEEWRPTQGWGDRYEVSNLGRVRSGRQRGRGGGILSPGAHKKGHLFVGLVRDGERSQKSVHALVLEAFVGPRPEGLQVRHLNGDPTDNRLLNLAYGTASENCRDAVRHGTNVNARKTHCQKGHPYDEANIYVQPSTGGRKCRTCKARRGREYEARKSARLRAMVA